MIYLNDVEEGGETAFPAADNSTYEDQVCDKLLCLVLSILGWTHPPNYLVY